MRTSSDAKVRELYEGSADDYAQMMELEIDLPVYADTLGRFAGRIAELRGPLVDTSCGSGHMLSKYHEQFEPERPLVGIDLSPRMVTIASSRLGSSAQVLLGDMRSLEGVQSASAAAVLSFFGLHHLATSDALLAHQEWHRVLLPGGKLVVATWEGAGPIDYGDASDVVALRYTQEEVAAWAHDAGFCVDRCVVEPVDGMPMSAVYLEGAKKPLS